jgi:hypothetical protein
MSLCPGPEEVASRATAAARSSCNTFPLIIVIKSCKNGDLGECRTIAPNFKVNETKPSVRTGPDTTEKPFVARFFLIRRSMF